MHLCHILKSLNFYGLGLRLQENLGSMVLFLDSILALSIYFVKFWTVQENSTLLVDDYPEIVELVEGGFILHFCYMYR